MAVDLQVQLERGTGCRPMLYLLAQSRKRAAEAIFALTKIDPTKTDDIRHLQNEVTLYDDMMASARELLARAPEEDRLISEDEREEIAKFLTPEQAQLMGLDQHHED
jgi:hypothetical protein